MKKSIVLTIILCLVLSLCGCGKDKDINFGKKLLPGNDTTEEEKERETTERETAERETTEEATTEAVPAKTYPITGTGTFSEGRAWVRFDGDSSGTRGVIDEDGNLIYSDSEGGYGTPFYDGASLYCTGDFWDGNGNVAIIDKDGNEIYRLDSTEEESYYCIGSYQGMYIIQKQISDFSESKYVFFVIDKNGKLVMNETGDIDAAYLGLQVCNFLYEGIYVFYYEGVYGYNDSAGLIIFNLITKQYVNHEYEKGGYDVPYINADDSYIEGFSYAINQEDFSNTESFNNLLNDSDGRIFDSYNGHSVSDVSYFDGVFLVGLNDEDNNKYLFYGFDANTREKKFDLPDYGESVRYDQFNTKISGKYAMLGLRGSDGEDYVIVIDNTGNPLYEPVKVNLGGGYYFDNGYILSCSDSAIITPTGEKISLSEDLSFLGNDTKLFEDTGYIISDGYITLKYIEGSSDMGYRSLDGSKEITEVIVN